MTIAMSPAQRTAGRCSIDPMIANPTPSTVNAPAT